jgi:hypothetical protein
MMFATGWAERGGQKGAVGVGSTFAGRGVLGSVSRILEVPKLFVTTRRNGSMWREVRIAPLWGNWAEQLLAYCHLDTLAMVKR